jgi:ribosomal protein S18 acetylase RimI-like enzyme
MGAGIGARLLREAIEAIAAAGGGTLEIASDPNAEGFYLRMGAIRVGSLPSWPAGRRLPLLVVDVAPAARTVRLRRTRPEDLDLVLALEAAPENAAFIGQWSREEHLAAIAGDGGREHWLIESGDGERSLGYLIAYDLVARGHGAYVKRIVIAEKARGLGRRAIAAFAERARRDLGADRLWLTVFADNERAQRSYAAAGLVVEQRTAEERDALRAVVGGFSATSLIMARTLAP